MDGEQKKKEYPPEIRLTAMWKQEDGSVSSPLGFSMAKPGDQQRWDVSLVANGRAVGRLWKNKYETGPAYGGFLGELRVTFWRVESQNPKAPAFRVTAREDDREKKGERRQQAAPPDSMDDPIPF